MPALKDPRREAFAWALAEGEAPLTAYHKCGYTGVGRNAPANARGVAKRATMVTRVEEIHREMNWSARADVGMVLNELAWLVRKASALGNAAGLMAAKNMLMDVVRLKDRIDAADAGAAFDTPPPPRMSREEWLATYVPRG